MTASASLGASPDLLAEAHAIAADLTSLRRDLHRIPELGLDLPLTQARVIEALDGLGLDISTGTSLSSVTAVLRGGRPGPAVLIRGDMDALPVQEDSGEEFASTHDGIMHACGHDLHMACVVGAARLLAAHRDELAGSVVFMFQPGEEGLGGAKIMLDEGILDAAGERVVAAFALHVMSSLLPSGLVASKPGTLLAAADALRITVKGRGGHGSMPHAAADPVPVACEIVLALEVAVTRQFDPLDPVVLSVGRINAGTVNNVIPVTATIDATIRTFSEATHGQVAERFTRVAEHVALAHGLTAEVVYAPGYPTTVNVPGEFDRAVDVATALGVDFMTAPAPIPGAEDFSYVLQEVPGVFLGLGATPDGTDPLTAAYNHSAGARFSESSLPVGAAMLAGLAASRLAQGRLTKPTHTADS